MPRWILLVLVAGVLVSCQQEPAGAPSAEPGSGVLPAEAPAPGNSSSGDTSPPLAYAGKEPPAVDPAEVPGPDGPFVEPPLLERPRSLHLVVVGRVGSLAEAGTLAGRLAAVEAVPVGYPAVDRAGEDGWIVVAGKFARPAYAQVLADRLRAGGFGQALVMKRDYRHDRFRPSPGGSAGVRAGLIFAGLPGMEVPVLAQAAKDAPGTSMVKDLELVSVTGKEETEDGFWYHLEIGEKPGFLPAGRVLVDPNVFPAPTGRRAVLGVPLGCPGGSCSWDYWLVGRNYRPRKLLRPGAERLPHAFSPDGTLLAYAAAGREMTLLPEGDTAEVKLGPGTSPAWSPDGKLLYFRRPATGGTRDEVVVAARPDWQVRTVLDYQGKPVYPRGLSLIPPGVDMREGGAKLYTMFYRLKEKDGGMVIHRWRVLFTPEGKIVSKKGEQITE